MEYLKGQKVDLVAPQATSTNLLLTFALQKSGREEPARGLALISPKGIHYRRSISPSYLENRDLDDVKASLLDVVGSLRLGVENYVDGVLAPPAPPLSWRAQLTLVMEVGVAGPTAVLYGPNGERLHSRSWAEISSHALELYSFMLEGALFDAENDSFTLSRAVMKRASKIKRLRGRNF